VAAFQSAAAVAKAAATAFEAAAASAAVAASTTSAVGAGAGIEALTEAQDRIAKRLRRTGTAGEVGSGDHIPSYKIMEVAGALKRAAEAMEHLVEERRRAGGRSGSRHPQPHLQASVDAASFALDRLSDDTYRRT
jgi:hypothetical protein